MVKRRHWLRHTGLGVAMMLCSVATLAGEVAGSVDAGLQELAAQIVQKSTAADRTKIAILPFPNADRSCSVLSTYIVDELTLALFSVPNSPLTIVERSQLEALINELTIGEGGLLNPETTKELGKISGVTALTVGTITVIGDTLRINSRLVATETGQTISAAAVSIPKTAAISDLMGQRTACGTLEAGHAGGGGKGTSGGSAVSGGGKAPPAPMPLPVQSGAQFSTGDLTFSVQNISRTADKKAVNLVLAIVNTGSEPLRVMFLGSRASLVDNLGNQAFAQTVTGVEVCVYSGTAWYQDIGRCWRDQSESLTTLTPQVLQTVLMRFAVSEKESETGISGDLVSFSSRMGVSKGGGAKAKGKDEEPQAYSISIPNIALR